MKDEVYVYRAVASAAGLPAKTGGRLVKLLKENPGLTAGELLKAGVPMDVIHQSRRAGLVVTKTRRVVEGPGRPRLEHYINYEKVAEIVEAIEEAFLNDDGELS